MTQEPEYIINGTKVEVGQVWERRDNLKVVVDRIKNDKRKYAIICGRKEYDGNGRLYSNGESGVDLIKCVGRVAPLDQLDGLQNITVAPAPKHSMAELAQSVENEPQIVQENGTKPKKLILSAGEMMSLAMKLRPDNDKYAVTYQQSLEIACDKLSDFIRVIEANPELMERVK